MSNPKRNNKLRLHSTDIYKAIANQTTLTQKEVAECFDGYYQLVRGIMDSEYKSKDLQIPFPKLGYFYFKEKVGRKKGDVFKMPSFEDPNKQIINVIQEDRPNYHRMQFQVSKKLQDMLRDRSEHYEE